MTNEQEKDRKFRENAKKIYDATKGVVLKASEKALEGATAFLEHPIDTTEKIYHGLKSAGKKALNFGVDTATNLLTDPQKALNTGLGLMEKGLNAIPVVGGFFSFLTGTAKDALTDKKFENLAKEISGLKEGLNSLADSVGEALDGLRGEMTEALEAMGARQDQLEQFTKAFKDEQEKLNQKFQQQIDEINETLKEHEKKIRDNAEKIFKEQIKLEDVRSEFKDQIRVTNTNLDNLRKEQEETKHDFEKYKHQINEKTAKTEQSFEDLQADYTRRNRIIETQIKDNEEQLGEFQENLANVEFQQKKLNLEHQEFAESLEEQINLSYEQRKRLDLVVNEIEDIQEEFHQKINRLQQTQLDQDEKIDEAVFAAKRATRKVEEISDKLEKHNQRIDKLQDKIERNKQDIQQAKHEAQRANERIDNLLKTQKLLDHTKETQAFNKIQKTLQLKAEEVQILASLELLKKTQKLITQPAEREWKVGIKEGTEKDMPRPEGFPLKPDCSWAKKYTPEQLREWGWDTRLLGDNESAPLTDLEKRKPQEAAPNKQSQSENAEQSAEQQKNLQEVIEETKSQLIEQLQEIQEQINESIAPLEKTTAPQEDSESEEENEELREELEKKEIKLKTERSQAKAKLTKSRNKQQSLQQQKAATKSEIIKEQKNLKKIEQNLGQKSTKPQQKGQLKENKEKSEEKLTQLQQQLEQIEQAEKEQKDKEKESEQEIEKLNKQIEKINQQKPTSVAAKKIEKEIRDTEQKANQAQHEYIEQQWQKVKKTEEQILNDTPETPSLKKIEEKVQEIKESQSSTASPQRSMSLYMLYLIIFLLEYIVYKKNGLTGLIVLNIILLICYWYKDLIMEHYKQNYKSYGKYLLIIGYIMGNVLTYSAPEQEKYKWPSVIGFNAILAALYGYTWWENKKEIETKKEELKEVREEFAEEIVKNETEYIERLQEAEKNLEKIKEKSKNYKTVNFSILSQDLGTPKNIFFANREEIAQARKLYEKITQNLAKKESEDYLTSPASQEFLQLVKTSGAELDDEEIELAAKIENKQKQQDYQAISQIVEKMPVVPNELTKILTKLLSNLQEEQIIAIFSQSYQVKDNQTELNATYSHLTKEQKLKLLNSGLDNLQINTTEQKQELLNIILTKKQEEIHFDLTITEKENILRLITSQISQNQLETYEEYGVPLYNAANWKITSEHKKSLLELAEDLITVDEEETKENLANADSNNLNNFSLSPQQENILKTLSPLRREFSYSDNLLKRSRRLNSRNFLLQKEIIPTEYKKITDPYQELKKEVLKKKYRQIREEIKQREKEKVAQENQELRSSLLPSLLYFAQMNGEDLANQEYRLSKTTFREKEDWVSMGAINSKHRDLLFLSGFKLAPRYYFFDLLFFAVENIHQGDFIKDGKENDKETQNLAIEEYKTQILTILDAWKGTLWGIFTGEQKEAIRRVIKILSDDNIPQTQQYQKLTELLNRYPNSDNKLNNLVGAWEKAANKGNYSPTSNWEYFLATHSYLKPEWEKYLELAKEREITEWKRKQKYLSSLSSSGDSRTIAAIPNITSLEEKYERLATAYEKMREYIEDKEVFVEAPENITPEPPTGPTTTDNLYDDLFANLDQEEAEKLRKKKAREEAKKKLSEQEFARRQANLSEKDRKAAEEAEKRQQEKELEEQEAEAARKRQEERDKNLDEDRKTYLDKEAERIKEAKKRAETELAFQEEQARKEREKKEQEIEEMKQKNEQEEREIAQKEELMKKELEEKLKEIATEDKEGRRRIKEKYDKQIAENQKTLNELKRKNDDEIATKKAQAQKEADQAEENLRGLRKQREELNEQADRAKRAADALDRELEADRDKEMALDRYRKELYDVVMGYYFISSEAQRGTRNPQQNDSGHLRSFVDNNPSIEFNLHLGDVVEANKSGNLRKAIMVFRKVAGNRFINKAELRSLIEEKVKTLDFI